MVRHPDTAMRRDAVVLAAIVALIVVAVIVTMVIAPGDEDDPLGAE